ncbi:DUF6036 family nucleotidyltransferase [Pampinifervens florentissimum]|uniref:DUF6036 family nucleotidyltransferase n=1 Tax=Pampinifervens florentissimum TaxID=1632019 RepID=UPI0013B4827C|nr:DUF6036 family nucleotidyltransferase [Hydrogenobacter sp. T-8]QID33166.1 hypothetical protein G3M65_05040 [Hydrogenobacter sp. T-8]
MRVVYERLLEKLSEKGIRCKLIAIGRSALSFYKVNKAKSTMDIDFEITEFEGKIEELQTVLDELGIRADYGEDIDRWGVVPLPAGYRDRAVNVLKRGGAELYVLSPVDFIISKLRRGTQEDWEDAIDVAFAENIKPEEIREVLKLIKPIRDVQFFHFLKRLERFLEELQRAYNLSNDPKRVP